MLIRDLDNFVRRPSRAADRGRGSEINHWGKWGSESNQTLVGIQDECKRVRRKSATTYRLRGGKSSLFSTKPLPLNSHQPRISGRMRHDERLDLTPPSYRNLCVAGWVVFRMLEDVRMVNGIKGLRRWNLLHEATLVKLERNWNNNPATYWSLLLLAPTLVHCYCSDCVDRQMSCDQYRPET